MLEITAEANDQAFTVIKETSASYILLLVMPKFEVFFLLLGFCLLYFMNFSITVLP